MSTLHHESLLESCHDEAWENFRTHNKLTFDQLTDLCSFSEGTRNAIERQARKSFDALCQ